VGYRDAIVSYVDLLGFRALIEASDADPSKVDDITGILQATEIKGNLNTGVLTNQGIEELVDTRIFSDLIVRTTLKRDELDLAIHLRYELMTLARIQWEFIQYHKVLVRGGVSYRKMNDQRKFLFGPGLVRAYELAEKIAVVPRIIIDSELVRLVGDLPDQWWKDVLGRGEDGQYFIDYLNLQVRLGDPFAGVSTLNTSILLRHRDFVLEEIAKPIAKAEKVRQKIIWMGLYHNNTVDRLCRDYVDRRIQLERLRIEPKRIA
jgi:hypothetical protein